MDEGQPDVRLQDRLRIRGLFAELDPFLEQGCRGLQMVPLTFKIAPAHIGRTHRWLMSTPLQGLLKRLAIGLICLVQMSLQYVQVSQVMDNQKETKDVIYFPTDATSLFQSNARCPDIATEVVGLAQIPGDIRTGHAFLWERRKSQA